MEHPEANEWLAKILSHEPMLYEEAYWGDRPPVSEVLPKLLEALDTCRDPYSRGKLIELLGESDDSRVMNMLLEELKNPDHRVQAWARESIQNLRKNEPWQK